MASVPAFLLVHTCQVEAYQSWGTYAPATPLTCFIAEALASAGPAGTERVAQHTIVCQLGDEPPPGSRITLGDGRQGYAHAVVRHDGGPLPVPSHAEIAATIAGAYGPAFGELIVLLRRSRSYGPAGAARWTVTEVPVQAAAVRILTSAESTVGTALTDVDTIEVVLPPGTAVATTDQLRVRGLLYDVDGTPEEVSDPQTTAQPGVKVIGKRRIS